MDHISEYDNIFHYFKGQTNDNSHNFQIENNVTKALINLLQHSPKELTDGLLRLVDDSLIFKQENDYIYRIQISERLNWVGLKGFILGIAEKTDETYSSDYSNTASIPDAAIFSKDVSVLIETKIGTDTKLDTSQIEKHKEKFHQNQIYQEDIKYLTWNEIRDYFKGFHSKYSELTATGFLLRQFNQFCEINGLGGKTREYYFNYFSVKARRIAKEVDEYLWNGSFDIHEPINTTRGIAYKRNKRRAGFGKLCTDRRCLILRFGSKGSKEGEEFQREVDVLLGKKYVRNKAESTRYTHETYVDLEWLQDLEQIKPFILKAYEMTP